AAEAADPEAEMEAYAALHPLGRIGEPEEDAAGIAFLLSEDASFLSGGFVAFDGAASGRWFPYLAGARKRPQRAAVVQPHRANHHWIHCVVQCSPGVISTTRRFGAARSSEQ